MKRQAICRVVLGLVLTVWVLGSFGPATCAGGEGGQRMLSHDVFFSLKDNSPAAKEKLIAACKKYLSDHPGTVWFSAGTLGEEFQRDVNDRDFDVALHLVFTGKAAHDKYAAAEKHLKFIEENQENWKKVRVFDSYVSVSAHGEMMGQPKRAEPSRKAALPDKPRKRPLADRPRKPAAPDAPRKPHLPDPAARFAGMIEGKVVQKYDGELAVQVGKVVRQWEHSKAKDANSLVGKTVVVNGRKVDGQTVAEIVRFIQDLKLGETVTLDVAHQGESDALTILELVK